MRGSRPRPGLRQSGAVAGWPSMSSQHECPLHASQPSMLGTTCRAGLIEILLPCAVHLLASLTLRSPISLALLTAPAHPPLALGRHPHHWLSWQRCSRAPGAPPPGDLCSGHPTWLHNQRGRCDTNGCQRGVDCVGGGTVRCGTSVQVATRAAGLPAGWCVLCCAEAARTPHVEVHPG